MIRTAGKGAIHFTAPANDGRESGSGASGWFGPEGYDRVHFRRYLRFAADYDQGNLNHVGGGLAAVAGADRWRAMGSAGIRPKGEDHFNSSFEPWRAWGRYPAPGYMFLYTYWMDMQRDPDGHFWGNMLGPDEEERITLRRDRWYCLEHMIQVNDVGKANGKLAAWIDGKLYIHYTGIRWRTSATVKLKRFDISVYVHQARKDNTVWYDDVALSTGYIGPKPEPETEPGAEPANRRVENPKAACPEAAVLASHFECVQSNLKPDVLRRRGCTGISLLFRAPSFSMPPRGTAVTLSSNPLKEPHHGRKCQTRDEE